MTHPKPAPNTIWDHLAWLTFAVGLGSVLGYVAAVVIR